MRPSRARWILRLACSLGMVLWLGGFTFYSAFVVSILHDELGSFQAGLITQRVTDNLNLLGAITLVPWWLAAGIDRASSPALLRRLRWTLLTTTTLGLLGLVVLHRSMDQTLESNDLSGFYPQHRVYLIVSTVMWVANVGLVVIAGNQDSGAGAGLASRSPGSNFSNGGNELQ